MASVSPCFASLFLSFPNAFLISSKDLAQDELWELMQDEKTHVYMCGLKGMESGMAECFGPIAEKNGKNWVEFAKAMKKADRYHVEVY